MRSRLVLYSTLVFNKFILLLPFDGRFPPRKYHERATPHEKFMKMFAKVPRIILDFESLFGTGENFQKLNTSG